MLSLSSMLSLSFTPELVLRPATRAALARQATPVMGVETELGALGPLGFWDPLGLVRSPKCTKTTLVWTERLVRTRLWGSAT